jgi:flagellar hook protein FlgE
VAINGNGFFQLKNVDGVISYTRNGQFHRDKDGYLVNTSGQFLQGYGINDSTLAIDQSHTDKILLSTADINPKASTTATLQANLDSTKSAPTIAFDPSNPLTYNNATSVNVFDSAGSSHLVSMYFAKSSTTAGAWDVHYTLDGAAANTVPASTQISFDTNGNIAAANQTLPLDLSLTVSGQAVTQRVLIDAKHVTQFGGQGFTATTQSNGYAPGRLSSFSISNDGLVQGRYSNGQNLTLGQVVVATFPSQDNLIPLGSNQWAETAASGQASVGVPGAGSRGALQASSVEESNVDLTKELVNMIVAQRAYQANAQTIKTQDQILSTLVNLR